MSPAGGNVKDQAKWIGILFTIAASIVGSVWVLSHSFVTHAEHDKDIENVKETVAGVKDEQDDDMDRIEEYFKEIRKDYKDILKRLPPEP
jgi:hypothetical protein